MPESSSSVVRPTTPPDLIAPQSTGDPTQRPTPISNPIPEQSESAAAVPPLELSAEDALRILREKMSGSTSRGTVIMPRPKSWSVGLSPERLHDSQSQTALHLPETVEQSHGSITPDAGDFNADQIANQQTVISSQPWAEPPVLGTLTSREMGKLLSGQTLGHYTLQEFVGGGGMGAVFRAHDTMLNRTVAVKVLAPNQSRDEDTLRRFQNEAQSAARLDHENIGRVHYVGIDRGWNYIVFEFIEGTNLRDLVDDQGPLSIAETINYLSQLTEALAHASQREVVHRDIKPSNVIITPEGKAKLVDMGLARLHQVEQSKEDLTASGVTLGTFDYISPEQARDPRSADVRSDLYSLGCTLYFMLTGSPPFPNGTVLQKLLQHQADEPIDPQITRSEIPAQLLAMLKRLMAKQPVQRYQTPSELLEELSELASELHLPRYGTTIRSERKALVPTRPTWYQHLPWIVPCCMLGLLFAGNLLWDQFTSRDQPQTPERPQWSQPITAFPESTIASNEPFNMRSMNENSFAPTLNSLSVLPKQGINTQKQSALPAVLGTSWQTSKQLAEDYWQSLSTNLAPRLTERMPKWNLDVEQFLEQIQDPLSLTMPMITRSQPELNLAKTARREHFIVTRVPQQVGEYSSLQAALRDVKPGETIELHWNGVLVEKPITLNQPDLTIVAGKDFRPILRFLGRDTGSLGASRGVVTVNGGNLRLQGFQIEYDLSEQASEANTLCDLRQVQEFSSNQMIWTVKPSANPNSSANIALFGVRAGLTSAIMRMKDPATPLIATTMNLERSIFRGNTSLLRTIEQEPLRMTMQQCVVGISEPALICDLGTRTAFRRNEAWLQCEVRDSSWLLGSSLLRVLNQERLQQHEQLALKFENLAVRGNDNAPLIDVEGWERLEELTNLITWESDKLRIDQFTSYLRLVNQAGTTSLSGAQWRELWRGPLIQILSPGATWEVASSQLPTWSQLTPLQFRWQPVGNTTIDNSLNSTLDGHDPSLLPSQLLK